MTLSATPATPATPATTAAAARGCPALLLTIVLLAQFMSLLDVFIVNVAGPTLQAELGASGGELQLIIAGYTIAYAGLLITGARLGGRHGPGRLFHTGLALFTASSLACGLAGDTVTLVAARFAQGTGAALMLPQVLSLIQLTFAGQARIRALTGYAAVVVTGATAGQLAGGLLVSADLFGWGWRSVFLVNVPIGVALLFLVPRGLPLSRPASTARTRGLDPAGTAHADRGRDPDHRAARPRPGTGLAPVVLAVADRGRRARRACWPATPPGSRHAVASP
ncbi:MFS transporter [Streptomyces sp. 8K308]|uniref:MFS transporter n=1 Tax=Streptomyces sp. 8K308 TaxID=2530388 RepID=UPI0026D499C3